MRQMCAHFYGQNGQEEEGTVLKWWACLCVRVHVYFIFLYFQKKMYLYIKNSLPGGGGGRLFRIPSTQILRGENISYGENPKEQDT